MKSSVVRAFGLFASVLLAGAAAAQSTQAVEWKVSEGGNGHWYQLILSGPISWNAAQLAAEARGGHLATPTSAAENELVILLADDSRAWVSDSYGNRGGPYLGGYQPVGAPSSSPWAWVTGEPWSWTGWAAGEPNNGLQPGFLVTILLGRTGDASIRGWADGYAAGASPNDPIVYPLGVSYITEWSADCNGDGVVDYGQIKNGQLDDDNNDGIPDACQSPVTGVIPVSGASSGGTAITVKGSNFPENPTVLVGGSPATNVVRVSPTRLTAVTPGGLPGMTSVTVGNWVQPNAFYYRPECGSDLDQDGEVTAADIAIVLLDFGPCYVTATSPQADDSKPFMLQEQPAPEAPQSR